MSVARATIGINGPREHEVFSVVAALLRDRGHEITYLDPYRTYDSDQLRRLDVLVNKRTRPGSVRTLVRAEHLGIPTWNSATGVMLCVSRISALCALAGVGFATPEVLSEPTSDDYVAKSHYHWGHDPVLNGEGELYEELLDIDSVDHKYYLVDADGSIDLTVVRATSKLFAGEKRVLGTTSPEEALVNHVQRLMRLLEMRALGVDFVRGTDGTWFAVDLNPGPSFRGTGMEVELTDSIEACLETSDST